MASLLLLPHSRPGSWLRGLLWLLAILAALAAVGWFGFHWLVGREWQRVRASLETEGETLDFRELLPPLVPDADNFCATRALLNIADEEKGRAAREALEVLDPKRRVEADLPRSIGPSELLGRRTDLKPWIAAVTKRPDATAADLLAALKDQEPIMIELVAALDRPHARWTPQWREQELSRLIFDRPLPHYEVAMTLSVSLSLRSLAAAEVGDATGAHAAVRILVRSAEACAADPTWIGNLVTTSGARIAALSAWNLAATQTGTAEDFALLRGDFARLDLEASALRAWRGELAAITTALGNLADANDWTEEERTVLLSDTDSPYGRFGPRALLRQNATMIARLQGKHVIKAFREEGLMAAHAGMKNLEAEIEGLEGSFWKRPGSFLVAPSLSIQSMLAFKSIHSQCLVAQAQIACALEAHQLTHGSYPATLAELPGDLPVKDLWSGQSMRYERTPGGRYRLWSVGPDRVDDGGRRTIDQAEPAKTKFQDPGYQGDWVWDYEDSSQHAPSLD